MSSTSGHHRELRDRSEAESWLAGGLSLMRLCRPSVEEHLRMEPWLFGVLSESGVLPPAGVIADIGILLTGGSLRSIQPLPLVAAGLGEAVHAYEDHLLGRLEADPRLDSVIDALARLSSDFRAEAIALFTAHMLQRLRYRSGVSLSPGVVRRVVRLPLQELGSRGHPAITQDGAVLEALEDGYQGLITGARRLSMLISEADVFLVENFEALGELTQRLAIEQIIEVADALSAALPRRLKPRVRGEKAHVPTPLAAEDNYPTGGFSSLSTSGSLENLVISELIYMEDGAESQEIDLFDLRYAEGELLYYTRDESVFVRGHRAISFVLLPDLERVRLKDPTLAWQRLIVILGLIACVVRRMAGWLAGEGLTFRIVFVAEADGTDPLAAERGLCALFLREWIDKEMAEVVLESGFDALSQWALHSARRARTDMLFISAGDIELPPLPGVGVGTIRADEPEPGLEWAHEADAPLRRRAEPGELWPEWVRLTLEVLQELL